MDPPAATTQPNLDAFLAVCKRKCVEHINNSGVNESNWVWRPKQLDFLEALYHGTNLAAVLPVGGGKNMLTAAAARAAKEVGMQNHLIIMVVSYQYNPTGIYLFNQLL